MSPHDSPLRKTIRIDDPSGELRFHLKKITAALRKIARCTLAVEHVYRLRLRLVNPLIERSFESRLAPFECAFLADRHSSVIIAAKKKQKLFEWRRFEGTSGKNEESGRSSSRPHFQLLFRSARTRRPRLIYFTPASCRAGRWALTRKDSLRSKAIRKTTTAPPADIHRVISRPYLSARVPAKMGVSVAPKISAARVASPIAVAAN